MLKLPDFVFTKPSWSAYFALIIPHTQQYVCDMYYF